MRKPVCPSDLTREQFAHIRGLLESARKTTRPCAVDLYEVFCAVLYLLRTGCQWRALPSDFPKWHTLHSYLTIWSEPRQEGSLLEQALKNRIDVSREKFGRKVCCTLLIVDAQSVKNTDTAVHKGYDAGKKVSGIKRHIAVDTQRLPHAVAATTAEATDRKGALQVLERSKCKLDRVRNLLAEGGYVGQTFAQGVRDILGQHVTVQIAQKNQLHTFKVSPKRSIVERNFA